MALIYKLQNKTNNKVYIGQTKFSLEYRLTNKLCGHFVRAFEQNCRSALHAALRKYGKDNFIYEVIEERSNDSFTSDEQMHEWLDNREVYWIAQYNSTNRLFGYNSTTGGQKTTQVWSKEKRLEHSERLKRYFNEHPEAHQKSSESLKRRYANMSKKEYENYCNKLKGKFKGYKHSEQSKKNMSEGTKRAMQRPEVKQKQIEGLRNYYATHEIPKEQRLHSSLARKGKYLVFKDGKGKLISPLDYDYYHSLGYERGIKAKRRQLYANG